MGRVIGIDYGRKRVGVAITDPMQIIATAVGTFTPAETIALIRDYHQKGALESVVVGLPKGLDNLETDGTQPALKFINQLKKLFPGLPVLEEDERFTSKIAKDTLVASGMKKSERRKKENLDKVSAVLILQSFLEKKQFKPS
jgi:putative Holliday junction resolvase